MEGQKHNWSATSAQPGAFIVVGGNGSTWELAVTAPGVTSVYV